MSVSAALVSSFLPFMQLHIRHSIIGRTRRFTSMSLGSTHDIKIMCNSHAFFSSPQKIGPRIEGIMTTIGTYVVVFSMSCTVSSLKNFFPIFWIVVEYGHCVCNISLQLWNVYLLSPELAVLECDPHHVIFRLPFSNRTQFF